MTTKYPSGSYVHYRDNHGDMIIARVIETENRDGDLYIRNEWYDAEAAVGLPVRLIKEDDRLLLHLPARCVERNTRVPPF